MLFQNLVIAFFIFISKVYYFYYLIGFSPKVYFPSTFWVTVIATIPGFVLATTMPAALLKGRRRQVYFLAMDSLLSLLMLVDVWNYRYFGAPFTIFQIQNMNEAWMAKGCFVNIVQPSDMWFLCSLPLWPFIKTRDNNAPRKPIRIFTALFLFGLALYGVRPIKNLLANEIIFSPFDMGTNITKLTPLGFHLHGLADFLANRIEHKVAKLSPKDRMEIEEWLNKDRLVKLKDERKQTAPSYGFGRGKNLILIQVEALENFTIGLKVNGLEVTPHLNRLLRHSLYFPNFFSQIQSGSTSDADFMVNTSLYPLARGSAFSLYPKNRYAATLPDLLKKHGYRTAAFHGNRRVFWNRYLAFPSLGFEEFRSLETYDNDEPMGFGLSDASFFRQTAEMLEHLPQPFYAFAITLTSHYPFNFIPPEKRTLPINPAQVREDPMYADYLNSVHYADSSLGNFLRILDQKRLLKNSIVAIVGDHGAGFSGSALIAAHRHSRFLKGVHRNIPLLIFHPALAGKTFKVVGGSVDILPTLMNIMGVERNEYLGKTMGRDLLRTSASYVVFSNGEYLSDEKIVDSDEKTRRLHGPGIADKIVSYNYFSETSKKRD